MGTRSLPLNVSPMKASGGGYCFCGGEFLSTWEKISLVTPTFFPCCITSISLKCSSHTVIFQGEKNLKEEKNARKLTFCQN